ncbi:MAG: protein phosphatase 2C domain-containing protein [Gallionella sp.]|nr:protein phosphatase 2C domain-containing protein [Gallionella sp.]
MNFSVHQASHIGNRRFNQDRAAYAYSSDALLLVLADGMGGHMHGELAASLTIETFVESFGRLAQPRIPDPDEFIASTMLYAHDRIMKLPHDRDMGGFPGTTCVAVVVQDDMMYWGHAGDSRLYLLRDDAVIVRTRDHSIVQIWFEQGVLSAEQARNHPQRNQITQCLGGIGDAFRVDPGQPIALRPGDVLLLGSDGLWGPFSDQELVEAFKSRPVTEVLDSLIERALKRGTGHSDNVTGIAVRWGMDESDRNTDEPVCHVLDIS